MTALRIFILTVLATTSAFGQNETLTGDFNAGISRFKVGAQALQAYCFDGPSGVSGLAVDRPQRIASVTKLFTTVFASEKLDLHKKYILKAFVANDSLHIEGGRDPYFEEEKMFLLMKGLNDLGYTSFKTITMDDNFIFSDEALSEHREITPAYSRSRLAFFVNKGNRKSLMAKWETVKRFASEEGVDLSKVPMPQVTSLSRVKIAINPLKDLGAQVFIHESLPFHRILKTMNVQSKNIVAHNVFLEASRAQSFDDFMLSKGFLKKDFEIFNGSGLPMIDGNNRRDNLATCRLVLKMMSLLQETLSKHRLQLSDIVAVNGGKDLGSFRERFKLYPETHQAVISKTGTLMQTSALAGFLMMDKKVPFAILNHTTNSSAGRSFQDYFVSRFFHHLGEPQPIPYEKISIFPWDSSDFFSAAIY
jgi:serine-type D-Ala-D-Ala carboxypeptidase/endopeptidase (penicillin-binding protein 4)